MSRRHDSGRQPAVTKRHTATMKDAVDAALQQAVDRELRLRHVRRLTDLDGIDLADNEVMAGARR